MSFLASAAFSKACDVLMDADDKCAAGFDALVVEYGYEEASEAWRHACNYLDSLESDQ